MWTTHRMCPKGAARGDLASCDSTGSRRPRKGSVQSEREEKVWRHGSWHTGADSERPVPPRRPWDWLLLCLGRLIRQMPLDAPAGTNQNPFSNKPWSRSKSRESFVKISRSTILMLQIAIISNLRQVIIKQTFAHFNIICIVCSISINCTRYNRFV